MKKYIKYLSVIIVLIVASLPLSAQDKVIKKLVDGENQRIVIYGTSLSASKEGWPAMLEDSLNMLYPGTVEVINSAQAAMWSTWGVENLRERVLEYKPDMVIIEFAMNDAYLPYTTSIEAARLNLEYMVYRIRELYPECSILIQVMNMPIAEHKTQRPDIELYYDMYRKEAKKLNISFGVFNKNCFYLKNVKDYIDAFKNLIIDQGVPDGIHPNLTAQKELVLPCILKVLKTSNAKR